MIKQLKNSITMFFIFLLLWGVIPSNYQTMIVKANSEQSHLGTICNPYIITSAEELNNVKNNLNAHYRLGSDINLSGYSNWTPIGTFHGSLDGAGYKITGLSTTGNALFLELGVSGKISNVHLENVNINTGSNGVGALVGLNYGEIRNSSSSGVVRGNYSVGGLVGDNIGLMSKSYSTATVEAHLFSGGGLAGANIGTIENSYASGNVNTSDYVGGLVGSSGRWVDNNFIQGVVRNSYSYGRVTGVRYIGGLDGTGNGIVINSYYDRELSGQNDTGKGEGKTTTELKQKSTFVGWDFDSTWSINETMDYPRLIPETSSSFTVTFNSNGGEVSAIPSTNVVNYGNSVSILPTEPTREGYDFAGWNTQANGEGCEFTASTPVTRDLTVYAQWNSIIPDPATILNVNSPIHGTYGIGHNLDFRVNWSDPVSVVGTPYLELDVGGTLRHASYIGGDNTNSLVFRYTVQEGDLDSDGINITSLRLNNGAIRNSNVDSNTDLNGVGNTDGIKVDGIFPAIPIIIQPLHGSILNFIPELRGTAELSSEVKIYAEGNVIGATPTDSSGNWIFTLQPSLPDGTYTLSTNVMKFASGNTSPFSSIMFTIDRIAPTVSGVNLPANGTYGIGQQLNFTVVFSESVLVTGNPRLKLMIGEELKYANYVSGSGSSELVFEYTVQLGDKGLNGISIDTLEFNGGSILDLAANDAILMLNNIPPTNLIHVETILSQVRNVQLNNQGVATWDAVSNASNYDVQLFKNGESIGSAINTMNTNIDILSVMRSSGAGEYTVKVTAKGNGSTTTFVDGPESIDSNSQIIIELETLSDGLTWEGNIAKWTVVDNAVSYLVQLYKDGIEVGSAESVLAADAINGVDFSTLIDTNGGGIYTFKVTAKGNEKLILDSNESAASSENIVAIQLEKVTNVQLSEAGVVTWDPITNASSYELQLYKDDIEVGVPKTTTDMNFDFLSEMRAHGAGDYSVKVKAVGNGTMHSDGLESEASNTQKVIKLMKVESLAWEGNIAKWNEVDNTVSYDVQLYKDELEVGSAVGILAADARGGVDFSTLIGTRGGGIYTFKVTAKGNSTLILSAEPSNSSNQNIQYVVIYDGNNHDNGVPPIDNMSYQKGNNITVMGKGNLEKRGYSFAGWNTKADGSGVNYLENDIFTMDNNNITLYANWKAVSSSGGGTSTPTNIMEKNIPLSGGIVNFNGTEVIIPSSALESSIQVNVEKLDSLKHEWQPNGKTIVSDILEITKDENGDFHKPVTITFTFDSANLEKDKHNIAIYWLDEERGDWIPLDNIKVDWTLGKVSGEVNHFTKFAVLATEIEDLNLKDIENHWAKEYIEKLVNQAVIKGYKDGTFKPNNTITRAEFTAIVVRAFGFVSIGNKEFSDTRRHWAKDEIATAYEHGLISGYNETSFGANDPITREQMAMIIVNAFELNKELGKTFTDDLYISPWAKNAVNIASGNGIITGYDDGSFKPKNSATRAEAVTVIVRAIEIK